MSETLGKDQKVIRKRVLHDFVESDEQKANDLLDREIKEETLYFLDAVKDEPLDEEFIEQNTPKLEEFNAPSPSAASTQHEVFDGLEPEPNNDVVRNDVISMKITQKSRNHRCPVCSKIQSRKDMKLVTIKDEKLMIMVGCIHRDKFSYEQALSFLSEKSRMIICYAHFSEVMDDIRKHINIKNVNEITSCSDYLMNILINIADHLRPPPTKWSFRKSLNGFFWKNRNLFRTVGEMNKEVFYDDKLCAPNLVKEREPCTLCSDVQLLQHIKHVTLNEEKLVIIVGSILRGECNLPNAKKWLSVDKNKTLICHAHFIETVKIFCNYLNIETLDEIDTCSDNLMYDLMKIVDYLRPQTKWPFRKSLKYFFTRNKDILKSLMPSQTEPEKKKPRSLHEEYIKEEIHDCSEMVKEEPFHERFEQFIDPCLPSTSLLTSPVFSTASQIKFKEVKHEDVFEKEIKQESDYMMEKVKEEPFEEDYYVQNITKVSSISSNIPVVRENAVSKCSNNGSVVDVKLEPIDNFNNDSDRCATSTEKIIIKTAVINQSTTKNMPKVYYHRCSICNSYDDPQNMKYTTPEEDILMIMIGCVLRNECTLERARLWMSYRKNILICHFHYNDSIREIYKNLNVRNPIEVMKCSMKMERNLKSVLNVLAPMLNTKDFQNRLDKFYWKNNNIIQLNATAVFYY